MQQGRGAKGAPRLRLPSVIGRLEAGLLPLAAGRHPVEFAAGQQAIELVVGAAPWRLLPFAEAYAWGV